MTLKVRISIYLRRLFLTLVSLTMTWFCEKIFIYNRCIHGFMSKLIKKSWKDSTIYVVVSSTKALVATVGFSLLAHEIFSLSRKKTKTSVVGHQLSQATPPFAHTGQIAKKPPKITFKKFVKLSGHTCVCNNLTRFECEVHKNRTRKWCKSAENCFKTREITSIELIFSVFYPFETTVCSYIASAYLLLHLTV